MIKQRLDMIRSDERGVTLVIVLAILLILLTLTSVAVSSAINVRESSTRNRRQTLALEAAQAGLAVANYRLNQEYASLSSSNCPMVTSGTLGVASPSVGVYCGPVSSASTSPALASNASYQYWTSKLLSTSGTCGNLPVSVSSTSLQRCIISVGTVGSVNSRLAELVTAAVGTNTLIVKGIEALNGVAITENSKGSIGGYGSVTAATIAVNPPANFTMKSCSPTPSMIYEPGSGNTSGESFDSSCSGGVTNNTTLTSNWPALDSSIIDGWFTGSEEGSGDTSVSTNNDNNLLSPAGFNYNSSTRAVTDTTSSILTLSGTNSRANSGGYYTLNLCSLDFTHAATSIVLNNGAKLNLLIDSNSRSVSGSPACPTAVASPFVITNTSGFNYSSTSTSACNYPPGTPGDPTALNMMVEGTGGTLSLSNQQGFSGALIAPGWNIKLTGGGGCRSVVWYGAIATNGSLTATNGLDFHASDESQVGTPGAQETIFARNEPQGWEQCASSYSSSSPDSGC